MIYTPYILALALWLGCFTIQAQTCIKPHIAQTGLRITENKGQWHTNVQYQITNGAQTVWLERNRLRYRHYDPNELKQLHPVQPGSLPFKHLKGHTYSMFFEGANPKPILQTQHPYEDFSNYFLGNDPRKWAQFVKSYQIVRYQNLYPNIDLKLTTTERSVKYDFEVYPDADVRQIRLKYSGVGRLKIKDGKHLVLNTCIGEIQENIPAAWQIVEGTRVPVVCEYKLLDDSTVGFHFPNGYINDFPLIIDPELIFSTYSGSSADNWGMTATYDREGNLYSGGVVNGDGSYPTTDGVFQKTYAGGADNGPNGFSYESVGFSCDMAIIKYNATGTKMLYSTYIGGNNNDQPASIIANEYGELSIVGTTRSANFPVTANAYDRTFNGLTDDGTKGDVDIVVIKLNETGSDLLGSTYIGSDKEDGTNRVNGVVYRNPLYYFFADNGRGEIITDREGNCYVAVSTASPNFPITTNAPQKTFGGDQDAVVFSFNPDLSQLRWSTFLGGTGMDAGYSLKINDKNELYVVGGTIGRNILTKTDGAWQPQYNGGAADGFLVHYSADGSQILQSTYLGTAEYDQTYFVDLDDEFNVYVAGCTEGDFPAMNTQFNRPNGKQFIVKLKPDLSEPIFSFKFGSNLATRKRPDITLTAFLVDQCDNIYVAGWGSNNQNLAPFFRSSEGGITSGNTLNLEVTPDAFQNTTSGSDFYIAVFNKDAISLRYATFIGGTHTGDHVDGGTSRFDKKGIIYHSVCGSCSVGADEDCPNRGPKNGCGDFPTTPGAVSRTNNSSNCNNLSFKFDMDMVDAAFAEFTYDTLGNEFCLPLKVNFNNKSEGAIRYEWDLGDGTTSTEENPNHTYTKPGVYRIRLRAINEEKCNGSDEAFRNIIIRDPSQADFRLAVDTCERRLRITNVSKSATRYYWNYGDGTVWMGTTPPEHQYAQPGSYTITLITDPGSRCSDTLKSLINIPDILQPQASIITRPCDVNVTFNTNLPDSIPVVWELGDGNVLKNHRFTYTYTRPDTYQVRLITYPNLPCSTEWRNSFIILDKKKADFTHSRLVCSIRNVTFNCQTNADSVIWDFGDGQTSNDLHPVHLYVTEGDFTVRLITNPNTACADTMIKVVKFEPFPQPKMEVIFDRCKFNVSTINETDTIITRHYWEFGDGKVDSTRNPQHTYTRPGVYTVKYTANPGGNDCSKQLSQTIEIFPKSKSDFQAQPNCFNEVIFYEKSQFASTFQWDFGDGNKSKGQSPYHKYAQAGTYNVKLITNAGTSCADSIIKKVTVPLPTKADFKYEPEKCTGRVRFYNRSENAIGGFFWDLGDGTTSTDENPIHVYKSRGSFVVRLTTNPNSTCPNQREMLVDPMPRSVAEIIIPNVICDTTVTFEHKSRNTDTYLWMINDSIISRESNPSFRFRGGAYHTITLITDPEGPCPDTDQVKIRVQKTPIARFEPAYKPCDLFVRFDNFSQDASQFFWEFGDGKTSESRFPNHNYPAYGSYTVRLTVNKDSVCYDISERSFVFGNPPDIDFEIHKDRCDSTVSFKPKRPTAKTYLWHFGDGSTSTDSTPVHQYKKHGKYIITLITDPGTLCERTISKTIELKKKVNADFEYSYDFCLGQAKFKNKSTGEYLRSMWMFGDGANSFDMHPKHTYAKEQRYRVKLVISNFDECTDTIEKVFDFNTVDGFLLEIPNVFTPNGDGRNDQFEIQGPLAQCFEEMMIFDRWGVKIFETRSLNHFWDGNYQSTPVPEGAYVFLIKVNGIVRVGTVTVLR